MERKLHFLDDIRICDKQPMAGCRGDDLFEIFENWSLKYKTGSLCVLYSNLYSLGKIHGKREERARRKKLKPTPPKNEARQYIDSLLDQLSQKDLRIARSFLMGMTGVSL